MRRTLIALLLVCAVNTSACRGASDAKKTDSSGPQTVWRAGDPTLGKWVVAQSGQCGTPVNIRNRFIFSLAYTPQGGKGMCGRNQAMPLDAGGSTIYLQEGVRYTWTFRYIDGTPYIANAPGMGKDYDARSSIWQIHGNIQMGSPCTGLIFTNGNDNLTNNAQTWGFTTCNGTIWHGPYTPGETDDWKIVAVISSGSDGMTQLYRNGVLQVTDHGANYTDSHPSPGNLSGAPWWNFGPYKWRWFDVPTTSSLRAVNMTIDDMTLTQG